jgi:Fic family protein
MADATADFASWLAQADIPRSRLTPEVVALLQAVFRFRQQQGTDYFSTRLLGHFLLHAGTGLELAQIARLLGISRPTASRQQNLSSKQAIQQAHHRLDGSGAGCR